ncbi:MAG TPA: hypothetical protein VLW50_11585 [Streptosporangiaceae bacterium]|nr:hypothetical protein [Streptosporangiaceae bacterium]
MATVEATSSQLGTVARLAAEFPAPRIVVDHFGWPPAGPRGGGRRMLGSDLPIENGSGRSTPPRNLLRLPRS